MSTDKPPAGGSHPSGRPQDAERQGRGPAAVTVLGQRQARWWSDHMGTLPWCRGQSAIWAGCPICGVEAGAGVGPFPVRCQGEQAECRRCGARWDRVQWGVRVGKAPLGKVLEGLSNLDRLEGSWIYRTIREAGPGWVPITEVMRRLGLADSRSSRTRVGRVLQRDGYLTGRLEVRKRERPRKEGRRGLLTYYRSRPS